MFVVMALAVILAVYGCILIEQSDTEKIQEQKKRRREEIKKAELENHVNILKANFEQEKNEYEKLKNEFEAMKQRESSYKEETLKSKEWAEKIRVEAERVKKEIELIKTSAEKKEGELSEAIKKNKQLDSQLKETTEKFQYLQKDNQDITEKLKELQTSRTQLESDKAEIEGLQKENRQLAAQLSESNQALEEAVSQSSEIRTELKKAAEKMRALEKENQDITGKLKKLQASSVKLESDNKAELEILQKENRQLAAQLSESNQALKETVSQSSEIKTELKKANEKIRALEKENQDITEKFKEPQPSKALVESESKAIPVAEDSVEEAEIDTWWSADRRDSIAFKKQHGITLAAQQKEKEIGEILLSKKLISKNILDRALQYQTEYGGAITQYLLAFGYIEENELAQCLCGHFKLPYLQLSACDIPEEIIKTVPADIAEQYLAIPIDKIGNTIMIAMQNPLDTKVIEILKECTGCNIRPFVGVVSEIITALEYYYHVKPKGKKKLPFFVESKAYTGLERRKSVRLKARLDITFPMQGQYKKSKTIDVSRNGFCFESDVELPIGSIFPLEISLPSQFSPKPVVALTKVVKMSILKDNLFAVHVANIKISKKGLSAVIGYASIKSKEAAI